MSYLETWDKSRHSQLAEIEKIAVCLCQNEKKEIPVLLNIRINKDSSYYHLGYDNIYGTSINADIYDWKRSDYKKLGVYVEVIDSVFNQEKIIALIEYGINHTNQLKKLRKKLVKLKEDRPDEINLNKVEIDDIIRTNLSNATQIIKDCAN